MKHPPVHHGNEPRFAPQEKYIDQIKAAIVDAFDRSEIGFAQRFGLDVEEKSLHQIVCRGTDNRDQRCLLRNHVRGMKPGVKLCLDGDEVLKRAK